MAFRGSEPVGWCAVEPRTAYPGLLRVYRVPRAGRAEDKAVPIHAPYNTFAYARRLLGPET